MTSLQEVATYLPARQVPVGEYLASLGFDDVAIKVHERYFGFSRVRLAPQERWTDQAVAAASGLTGLAECRHRVRYLLQARTLPVAAPYPVNPLHEVRRSLGLDHAGAFCVTQQACASALAAVALAGRLLAEQPDPAALVLVLTGEKVVAARARLIADTGVMGEGTAAVLVGLRGERDRVLGYATHPYSEPRPEDGSQGGASSQLHRVYPELLESVVRSALEQAGLRPRDIDWVLPHHANRVSWTRLAKRIGIPVERIFLDNLPTSGHCFGADSFINYRSLRARGILRPGHRYVMTAVGVGTNLAEGGLGAMFSAMVFEH